jgi:hypothetical protein
VSLRGSVPLGLAAALLFGQQRVPPDETPAGKYRLRGAVQDASDGKITATSLLAEIQ